MREKITLSSAEHEELLNLAKERSELMEKLKEINTKVGNALNGVGTKYSVPPGATFILSTLATDGSTTIEYEIGLSHSAPSGPSGEPLGARGAKGIEISPISIDIDKALKSATSRETSGFVKLYEKTTQWLKGLKK